jgi:hypothetical protein
MWEKEMKGKERKGISSFLLVLLANACAGLPLDSLLKCHGLISGADPGVTCPTRRKSTYTRVGGGGLRRRSSGVMRRI